MSLFRFLIAEIYARLLINKRDYINFKGHDDSYKSIFDNADNLYESSKYYPNTSNWAIDELQDPLATAHDTFNSADKFYDFWITNSTRLLGKYGSNISVNLSNILQLETTVKEKLNFK